MPDTDILEQDQDIQPEGQVQQDEPQTSLPDHAAGEKALTRQEQIDQTLAESGESALQEAIVDELATKPGELTVDDLRKLPGASEMSDDELKAEWAKAVKAPGGEADSTQAADQTFKLPF